MSEGHDAEETNGEGDVSRKGSNFERDFCRTLTEWWLGGPSEDVAFWRTAGSGGRATNRRRRGRNTAAAHCGDVAAIDHVGVPLTDYLSIELKRGYSKHTIADLLDQPRTAAVQEYEKWVGQAADSCRESGAFSWLLVHQRNRRLPVVIFPTQLYVELMRAHCFPMQTATPLLSLVIRPRGRKGRLYLTVTTLRKFLREVHPDAIRRLSAAYKKRRSE